jgi:hypothetical protein
MPEAGGVIFARQPPFIAFSSEVAAGLREENASKQKPKARF